MKAFFQKRGSDISGDVGNCRICTVVKIKDDYVFLELSGGITKPSKEQRKFGVLKNPLWVRSEYEKSIFVEKPYGIIDTSGAFEYFPYDDKNYQFQNMFEYTKKGILDFLCYVTGEQYTDFCYVEKMEDVPENKFYEEQEEIVRQKSEEFRIQQDKIKKEQYEQRIQRFLQNKKANEQLVKLTVKM